ncbi:MAG: aminotransferase class I/II-fold pyridoxal phosphate-dependent enzyme [Opitutae bacterium]|nr:aminotransferase class I/II-fold pyridoxal phosphate-dependent enzyme [Opitutae bacterium]MBT5380610.1 aminotransferase class I/II-fold pyridoxal phosphate-dependent enzyme [Opitutae bacterium]MBT5689911.1 aminotransferase class I/II-fold pyridoxal phosphate-dependent enzyme [Opitutae bacterium]MBT6462725.1 aminotransferase class I/II-fold pyridoxal phosphate-dependent enzyme [Opitutae bacterium]MBT6958066.1 aminotransferase class I/II-fold pyridoxal phosphate-dependent enzyme [Opitutae bact
MASFEQDRHQGRIYLSPPDVGSLELARVKEAFTENWIAPVGPHLDAFEREISDVLGGGIHAAALNSGTAALHLALLLSGVVPGDEVICSTFTFVAPANAIRYIGASPVFIDSEATTWNLDAALLAEVLKQRASKGNLPKAVVVVHLYGQSADLKPILQVCREHGVILIEDAAEALGSTYLSQPLGTVGDFGVFSFNGNKIITTSAGGMLVSRDAKAVDRARFLASQARDPASHYEHSEIGFNYRMSNVLAGIGRAQLDSLAEKVAKRRSLYLNYREALRDLPGIGFIPETGKDAPNRWLTCITIDSVIAGIDTEVLRVALEARNIESRPLWKPMHLQPLFADAKCYGGAISENLFLTGLCLPSGSSLAADEFDRVVTTIRGIWR